MSFTLVIYVEYSMFEDISVLQLHLDFQGLFFFVYKTLVQGLKVHRRTPALFAVNSHPACSGNSHCIVGLHANKF